MAELRSFDPLVDHVPARYVVGIDLGTTNSAVSYIDVQHADRDVQDLRIPQIVAPGQVEARETLPSFHYQAAGGETAQAALRLPWMKRDPNYAVGVWARDEGGKRAGRLIASAKSWLCHSGVDRTADLLPWHAAADVERLSPVEVNARYLGHIRDAWDAQFPQAPLSQQDVILTLPASFDEVARELTVAAAAQAGLTRVVLIEEPQAAFYAWIDRHRTDWQQLVQPGQTILICDIGGGTTDFTLLRVRAVEGAQEKVQFHRVAVGDHLILGGDNLDLALAQEIERKLSATQKLDPRQWDVLVRTCRHVKEMLLSEPAPEKLVVHLPGSGAKLIGGGRDVEVSRDEVRSLLLDGFLPHVKLQETPLRRASGFQEFGLPYAPDAAMTRYLAYFLRSHRHAGYRPDEFAAGAAARPDIVLFNGGFFASPCLRDRLLAVLSSWFEPGWAPHVLDNVRLDLAVARGAAYYGMVRRGEGVRITANAARSYYIGVESSPPSAVCLLPGDASPGDDIHVADRSFLLTIAEPVEFPVYVSSTRLTDRPGEVVPVQIDQMKALPPIRTVLRSQRRSEAGTIPVELHARLSEIGTIELWCSEVGRDRTWRLQFDVRSATQTDIAAHASTGEAAGLVDESVWQACETLVADVFGPAGPSKPEGLVKRLSQAIATSSHEWPPTLLRRIWESLLYYEEGRRKSSAHEARWLNLLGFALRPGYGLAADDWRVAETWRTVRGKLCFGAASTRIEALILWRRIAGGLSSGQQRAIGEPLLNPLTAWIRKASTTRATTTRAAARGQAASDAPEMLSLFASLELLPIAMKIEVGDLIADWLRKTRGGSPRNPLVWALGRLGQRVPVYGPLNTIVPADAMQPWLVSLLDHGSGEGIERLAVMQLARRTDDRYRDLSLAVRDRAAAWLERHAAPPHLVHLVREGGRLDAEEQVQIYGESLPKGLRIA
ncbi:MAG: Hsp70 family protein [Pirellulaceae bacterium]